MLCTCSSCKYVFQSPLLPDRCPDCGKPSPRKATLSEVSWYESNEKEKRDYQRMFTHPQRFPSGYNFV